MDWFSKAFLKSSLTWFGIGTTLGAVMSTWPSTTMYRTAHFHMNLLGFVSMMIFGVAYHAIPRFVGHPLHQRRLAIVHWWVANIGLAILSTGFMLVPTIGARAFPVQAVGGTLSAVGAYLFIYNIWRTLDGPTILRRVQQQPSSIPLLQRD
ncbi:MAG: cbb3-type cytochrome c oxidase subunit I [Gemmatimonadaceae bacterium]|nr:cbb3-type cytochrome c oxidase subunit I [Gemmatimonadaceae bacterium]